MKVVVLVFVFLSFGSWSFAQQPEEKLKELGFENVDMLVVGDTMYVALEDPVYRGTFRGAGVALKNLSLLCPGICKYKLVIKENNISKIAIDASFVEKHWDVDVDYNSSSVVDIIRNCKDDGCKVVNYNSSIGKVDITVYPILSFANNLTNKLFSYGAIAAPAFEVSAWKGNRSVLQPLIPLFNNYGVIDANPTLSRFQFGSVTIQQDVIDNSRWWCRAYAGFFHYNYVGLNLDLGIHLNKYLDLGLKANAVRVQNFDDGTLNVTGPDLYSSLLSVSYYEPKSSVEFRFTGGRYLYGDYGCRVDGICHFGEYCIGLYGIYSDKEYNGGFHFSIPVAGKSQKRMGYISVRVPEFFDWEYAMVSNYDWVDKRCGRVPEVLPARKMGGNYWQAKYVQSYLQKYLEGEVE